MQDSLEDLRRHVVASACNFVASLRFASGGPKVYNLDVVIYSLRIVDIEEDDVVKLDIAMNNPKPMQIGQRAEQLLHDIDHQ